MAIIKAVSGCVLYAGFDLYPLILETGEYVEFICDVAAAGGRHTICERMTSDGTGTGEHTHTTLSVDLAGLGVVPGIYDWELTLVIPSGSKFALLPKRYNRLIIEESEDVE